MKDLNLFGELHQNVLSKKKDMVTKKVKTNM